MSVAEEERGIVNPAFDVSQNNNEVQLRHFRRLSCLPPHISLIHHEEKQEERQQVLQLKEINEDFADHSSSGLSFGCTSRQGEEEDEQQSNSTASNSNINNNSSSSKNRTTASRAMKRATSSDNNNRNFTIFWTELSLKVNEYKWSFNGCPEVVVTKKTILHPSSGLIIEASMTAIMGPSGSGKSTLMRCLLKSSDIKICIKGSNRSNFKMSFIPQADFHFEEFTVRESLMFSSKIRNRSADHAIEVSRVVAELNLTNCEQTQMKNCSGGQRRRVSIAIELLSRPDILLMDEPISGLDSSNAKSLIDLLKRLTAAGRTTVLTSIHQPSAPVFGSFDQIYLLSSDGRNIYRGPPAQVSAFLQAFNISKGLAVASDSDWMIEIASGNCPSATSETMKEMAQIQLTKPLPVHHLPSSDTLSLQTLLTTAGDPGVPPIKQLSLLALRSLKMSCLASRQFVFKFCLNVLMALMVSLLWTEPLGSENGCWADQRSNSTAQYLRTISRITGNCNFLFSVSTYVLIVYSVASVLVIPLEFNTVYKELTNKWYPAYTYFVSKSLADLPITVVTLTPMILIGYHLTEQITDHYWRLLSYLGVYTLFAYACESLGALIGVIFSFDLVIGVLVTMTLSFPTIMFSGFLVKSSDIPWYFSLVKYTSLQRFTLESVLVTVYGFDRCKNEDVPLLNKDRLGQVNSASELLTLVWNAFNVTKDKLERFAELIDVSFSDQLEPVINGTVEYFGLNDKHSSEEEADSVINASYVLSYYELEDDTVTLVTNVTYLVVSILLLRMLLYLTICFKTQNRDRV